ncbi:hypothetical protein L3X38_010820 [Prunus dulcis]|uniref:Uncharacterized protein n=1 Tax=Prunus dulcis TaxID=3755 RepID=A0AAD4WGK5_PRUDU|nr:hypothetical protein L3X38_010820 [Prunus dulcis]
MSLIFIRICESNPFPATPLTIVVNKDSRHASKGSRALGTSDEIMVLKYWRMPKVNWCVHLRIVEFLPLGCLLELLGR